MSTRSMNSRSSAMKRSCTFTSPSRSASRRVSNWSCKARLAGEYTIVIATSSLSVTHTPLTPHHLLLIHEQVTGLAVELPAQSLQRRETDCPRLIRLQDGEIRQRDLHPLAHLGERHAAPLQQTVERYLDRHGRSEERRVGKECRSRWWP